MKRHMASCTIRLRRVAPGLAAVATALVVSSPAMGQKGATSEAGTDRADREWAHREGTSLLVLEPPQISGAGRWVLESPRHRGSILCMAVSPDGTRAATGGTDAVVRIWNLADGALEKALAGHSFHLHTMAWSPDGGRLAVSSIGSPVTVLDASSGSAAYALVQEAEESTTTLAFSPDGMLLATGGGRDAAVWAAADGGARWRIKADCTDLAWSPDGARLVTVGPTGLSAWNVADGKPAWKQSVAGGHVHWSADTGRIAVASTTRLAVRDGDDGADVRTIDAGGGTAPVFQAGRPVITGLGTPVLSLWDPATLKRIQQLEGHGGPATAAVWSRDGRQFATADAAGSVRIWDAKSWSPAHTLEAGKRPVSLLEWSPDGKLLAAAGGDKVVRVCLVVSRCGDRTVRFWDPAGGSLRGSLLAEGESLVAISTSGDVKFDPAVPPGLIAIVEAPGGQQTMPLDDLAKRHGWKNRGTMMRLPAKN